MKMIKLTFCLRRKQGMTLEAFQAYWRGAHAAMVAERANVLGIRRYVQVHTTELDGLHQVLQARNGGSPEPFDGVAELWFDSLEGFRSQDPDARAASAELLADERTFIDLASSPMFVGEEYVVVD